MTGSIDLSTRVVSSARLLSNWQTGRILLSVGQENSQQLIVPVEVHTFVGGTSIHQAVVSLRGCNHTGKGTPAVVELVVLEFVEAVVGADSAG